MLRPVVQYEVNRFFIQNRPDQDAPVLLETPQFSSAQPFILKLQIPRRSINVSTFPMNRAMSPILKKSQSRPLTLATNSPMSAQWTQAAPDFPPNKEDKQISQKQRTL